MHVVPGGEARRVEVVSSTLGDRGLEECMKGAFRSVTWRAPAAALRSPGAEVVAPQARGLIAQGLPARMAPTIAGPFNLFLRLGPGGTVAVELDRGGAAGRVGDLGADHDDGATADGRPCGSTVPHSDV